MNYLTFLNPLAWPVIAWLMWVVPAIKAPWVLVGRPLLELAGFIVTEVPVLLFRVATGKETPL